MCRFRYVIEIDRRLLRRRHAPLDIGTARRHVAHQLHENNPWPAFFDRYGVDEHPHLREHQFFEDESTPDRRPDRRGAFLSALIPGMSLRPVYSPRKRS